MDRRDSRPAPPGLAYSPGLDGLRAVACLAVMFYHAKVLHMVGGFLGVPVFFALSGFLITSLLAGEMRDMGRIDVAAFWRRRVRRIQPLLWFVVVTWGAWGMALGGAGGRKTVIGGISALLLAGNWVVAHQGGGMLQNTWSISVEEQFYVLWPLVLRRLWHRAHTEEQLARWIAYGAIGFVAAGIYAGAGFAPVWLVGPMVDGILFGALVALGWRCRSRVAWGLAGMTLAGLMVLVPRSAMAVSFSAPVAAVCAAALIPMLQTRPGILGSPLFVAVGKRSYGLYLWSYPLTLLAWQFGLKGSAHIAVAFGLTFLLTELTYRRVEVPLRRRRGLSNVASPSAPSTPIAELMSVR